MAKRVLIAGASGSIGFHALQLASQQGVWTRTLSQRRWRAAKVSLFADDLWIRDATNPESIHGICNRIDVVLSCMGGSVCMQDEDKRAFSKVDFEANLNLLQEAQRAEVGRFVYLSVYGQQRYENTAYVRAHRRFERALRESGLKFTIVRITGTYSSFDPLVEMARAGSVPLIGSGDARLNPIHPKDAARICVEHLFSGPEVVEAGGPEVLTRREIAEQIFQYVGEAPSLYRVPGFILRLTGSLTRPFNARKANLLEFLPAISASDSVAPVVGQLRLVDYLRELTGGAILQGTRAA
ncbi:MAG: NAD(P)H-binding protein [Bryobacterales bacterium]|nr:NAD(P)H-binding protein [Bryobacterales bacterium]